jgi:hypothetical protein
VDRVGEPTPKAIVPDTGCPSAEHPPGHGVRAVAQSGGQWDLDRAGVTCGVPRAPVFHPMPADVGDLQRRRTEADLLTERQHHRTRRGGRLAALRHRPRAAAGPRHTLLPLMFSDYW